MFFNASQNQVRLEIIINSVVYFGYSVKIIISTTQKTRH